ncbi:hypothetical protein [Halobacterium yunchengense]|uniref:hypothetical protein n=1 Tax=Halobacterium yunchengense TaxID=3108497 RepID=UPI003008BCD1
MSVQRPRALVALRATVWSLAGLLALALLTVGTVALVAEIKGTWHWMIHLESTISYVGVFVQYVVAALVPASVAFAVARWRWSP